MNRYFKALMDLVSGKFKTKLLKIFHYSSCSFGRMARISPSSEIIIHKSGKMIVGAKLKLDYHSTLSVLPKATMKIGNNVSFGCNNIIVAHQEISIGNGVQFSPNVMIYDHDHDFRAKAGIGSMKYKTSPVCIGDNVWIGACTVILRGSKIGNNCVIGAGCVIKNDIPDNTVVIQKREEKMMEYSRI